MLQKLIMLSFLVMALLSCSTEDSQPDVTAKTDQSDRKDHMLSDQEKLLEKAKETEKKIKEADEKRRQKLDDQDG